MVPSRMFNSPGCSSSSLGGRTEHRDWTKDRGPTQWSPSRYSAFDNLRFCLDRESQMGWSSYLLGEGDRAMVVGT